MNEDQKNIVKTIKNLAAAVEEQRLFPEQIPVSDLKEALRCTLHYKDNNASGDRLAEMCCDVLQTGIISQNAEICQKTILLMAELMEHFFEQEEYHKGQEEIILQNADRLLKDNVIYEEILAVYRGHKIDDAFLENHTCQSLVTVKERGTLQMFWDISKAVHTAALKRINRRGLHKIMFLVKDSAEWSCEELYHKLIQIPGLEVEVLVAPFMTGTPEVIRDTYLQTLEWFKKRGYRTTGAYDLYQNRYLSWNEIGVPDIMFHLNPHYTVFQECANICNMSLSVLNIYIPYGILIYGNVDAQFNQLSHMLYWEIFCESKLHKEMAKKYALLNDRNVEYSGYLKMDSFYVEEAVEEDKIWKTAGNKDKVKKKIYAPHWSVKDAFTGFGNFDKIYNQIYEYAKEHKETTAWVFRPHPMLRAGAVSQGVFASTQEYDEYLKKWDALPNARVIEQGIYIDIFKSSDAMILDSVSFLGEYLYAHKPMLFLTRDRQTFNDFGQELVKVLYSGDGGDFAGIEKFIQDVVMDGKDEMQDEREQFFRQYLDYRQENGMLASDYIWQYIQRQIETAED